MLIDSLSPKVWGFKIGLELITAGGPTFVDIIHRNHANIFYDGKFNDIPNTIERATKEAVALGVNMFNIHASSGVEAMRIAAKNKMNATLLAVTVLTSLSEDDCKAVFGKSVEDTVRLFAENAKEAGCDGIICSSQDLRYLNRYKELKDFMMVTPGIRPEWAALNDQKRVMTPGEAVKAGASKLVIGRPITNPPNGMTIAQAVEKVLEEVEEVI